jgi:crossover junction endodeoxyribonuclease RuvC
MGIDPGSSATGYGVIIHQNNLLSYVDAGVIRLSREKSFFKRMEKIYFHLKKVIDENRPDVSAIEDVFVSANPRSSLLLGHARGVAILAAVHGGLDIYEYTPTKVKQAVVGYGRAEKKQVQHMVKIILNLKSPPAQDAADALAVAICHAHSSPALNRCLS